MPPYDPRGTGLFPEPTPWNGDPEDEGDPNDFWCEECHNTGSVECYCGGDLCVCENNGEEPCPVCGD